MRHAQHFATAIGCIAILLWGMLALLSKIAALFPPFQLLAMCFSVASCFMLLKWWWFGQSIKSLCRQPLYVWLISCAGLFFYHVCYFLALKNAPVLEASLIAYLWPLLIVIFSSFLPSHRLHFKHLCGAVVSLLSCWILLGGAQSNFDWSFITGYLFAATASIIWASYSVLCKTMKAVPTDALGLFCAVCALLGWICHFTTEQSYLPADYQQWLAVIVLGLGPLGLAFFAWDFAIKRGDIQLLAVLSYATPLISTLLLIIFSDLQASTSIYLGCSGIVAGAFIASFNGSFFPQKKK